MHTGIRHVVDIEEFAARRAGAPDHDVLDTRKLGFVEAADQRCDDVAVFGVIIVARARAWRRP